METVLFVTSEAYPLAKTGGLGDVSGSLPRALHSLGHEARILMPAYRDTLERAEAHGKVREVAGFDIMQGRVRLLETVLPGTRVKVWLVDYPAFFDRAGNPYLAPDGQLWHDNADRFHLFARTAVEIACDRVGLNWQPTVVHCNDWQAGLVPALLSLEPTPPATVFTIHNIAYQGLFPYETFVALGLPDALWSHHALEFHGHLSFIKGGLVYADRINTVSPGYAQEIQTPLFGYGLDGLLQFRTKRLSGILNGIDTREWNPGTDPHLIQNYNSRKLDDKQVNKLDLQKGMQLSHVAELPLFGFIGRLVEQKGIDLILDAMPQLVEMPMQLVMLGTGEARFEQELSDWSERYPDRVSVTVGYDEKLAHRIEASADMFLMPSKFEPCGLNQMYSLRYGTVPVVRRVGGLADTVTDTTTETLADGTATGFTFESSDGEALLATIRRGAELYADRTAWRKLQINGMRCDHSWRRSAAGYQALYEQARRDSTPSPEVLG
ncbi:MAG: glycogen synthase GlgA [Pseudomonadota bacterium]|nr:MAG: glycogen synthase GlgA [Pseudomonadota bacterium]